MGGWKLVKLEVLGDKKTLLPNMIETLNCTKSLVKEGFKVMVYCSDDPLLAKNLRIMVHLRSCVGFTNRIRFRYTKYIEYFYDN